MADGGEEMVDVDFTTISGFGEYHKPDGLIDGITTITVRRGTAEMMSCTPCRDCFPGEYDE